MLLKTRGAGLCSAAAAQRDAGSRLTHRSILSFIFRLCVSVSFSFLDPNQYSWGENYAGSSGLMSTSPDVSPLQRTRSGTVCAVFPSPVCVLLAVMAWTLGIILQLVAACP